MQRIKLGLTAHASNFISAVFGTVIMLAFLACAQAQPTNLAVTVCHAPSLNGNGLIEGSLQQLLGENVTLNGGCTVCNGPNTQCEDWSVLRASVALARLAWASAPVFSTSPSMASVNEPA